MSYGQFLNLRVLILSKVNHIEHCVNWIQLLAAIGASDHTDIFSVVYVIFTVYKPLLLNFPKKIQGKVNILMKDTGNEGHFSNNLSTVDSSPNGEALVCNYTFKSFFSRFYVKFENICCGQVAAFNIFAINYKLCLIRKT